MEKYFVATIFLLYGVLATLKPKWIGKYQVWVSKNLLGAKFRPSPKTYQFYRAFGFLFVGLGVLIFFGLLQ